MPGLNIMRLEKLVGGLNVSMCKAGVPDPVLLGEASDTLTSSWFDLGVRLVGGGLMGSFGPSFLC